MKRSVRCPKCECRMQFEQGEQAVVIQCPKCRTKIKLKPKAAATTPPPPIQEAGSEDSWFIDDGSGRTLGPFLFNDIQNYASQNRLSLEASVLNKSRTNDQWVSVTRIPELADLMSRSASLQVQIAGAVAASTKAAAPDFSRSSAVSILVSAISNIIMALVWIGTCFGIPLGVVCIALCVLEFVFYSKRDRLNRKSFREETFWIGLFEIIVGLFNTVALICGIITLINRPPERPR